MWTTRHLQHTLWCKLQFHDMYSATECESFILLLHLADCNSVTVILHAFWVSEFPLFRLYHWNDQMSATRPLLNLPWRVIAVSTVWISHTHVCRFNNGSLSIWGEFWKPGLAWDCNPGVHLAGASLSKAVSLGLVFNGHLALQNH